MIVVGRQVHGRSVAGKAGNDAPMFFDETGDLERMPELLPLENGIGYNSNLFVLGQRMDGSRQGSNGFFNTFVRRRQFELGIEEFQAAAKFVFEEPEWIVGIQCGTYMIKSSSNR